MEERIRERFSPQILNRALAAFGIQPDAIQELDGFESFIYEFERAGETGILRITHDIRRSPEMVQGELDWINYLKAGGAGVAGAMQSLDGNLSKSRKRIIGNSIYIRCHRKERLIMKQL